MFRVHGEVLRKVFKRIARCFNRVTGVSKTRNKNRRTRHENNITAECFTPERKKIRRAEGNFNTYHPTPSPTQSTPDYFAKRIRLMIVFVIIMGPHVKTYCRRARFYFIFFFLLKTLLKYLQF